MEEIRILVPTVLFLIGYFQMSAISIWAGTEMVRHSSRVGERPVVFGLALATSAVIFLVTLTVSLPIGHLLAAPIENLGFLLRSPFVKLSYAPTLAILGAVLLLVRRLTVIRRFGTVLVVSGVMVALMMIFNDLMW